MFGGRRYAVREEHGIGASYGVYSGNDEAAESDDEPLLTTSKETLAIKEDFRFSEPETGEEVLWVKAESVLDIAAAYDVIDERTGEYVGSIERSVRSVSNTTTPSGTTTATKSRPSRRTVGPKRSSAGTSPRRCPSSTTSRAPTAKSTAPSPRG